MFGPPETKTPAMSTPRRRSWSLRIVLAACLALVVALYTFTPAIVRALDEDNAHVLTDQNGLAATTE